MLVIGSFDDLDKIYIFSVPLGEHLYRIFHQNKSRTFSIYSMKWRNNMIQEIVNYFVHLFDEETFENISSYPLDNNEEGCSIMSCSFTDENNVYYCIGTTYRDPNHLNEVGLYKKGRISVFLVEDRKLHLVTEKETIGAVYNINAFHEKLLIGINQKIELYKWVICDNGSAELDLECGNHGHVLATCVKTRRYFILVGDFMKSIYLLVYKHEQGGMFEEKARDYSSNSMTAVEFLDDDIYLGAESDFNIFTVMKNNDAAIGEEEGRKLGFAMLSR